jgi:hypothetical protein
LCLPDGVYTERSEVLFELPGFALLSFAGLCAVVPQMTTYLAKPKTTSVLCFSFITDQSEIING